jgi:hypothetical protein
VTCSCPYFGPFGDPCKHLWATVLAVDARRLLAAAPVRPLKLVSDPPRRTATGPGTSPQPGPDPGPGAVPGLDPYLGPGPVAGPGPRPGPGPNRHPGPGPRGPGSHAARGPAPRPAHGPGPSNAPHLPYGPAQSRSGRPRPKDRQASGRSPLRSQPHPGRDPAHAKQAARNTKGLLVYILDVPATLNQNQVVIDLARRQRRPGGDWGPLKPWWHAPAAFLARYDPEDRDLLALLERRGEPPRPPAASSSSRPAPARRPRPPRRWSTSMRHVNGSGWSATAASRWGRGGTCSGTTRRRRRAAGADRPAPAPPDRRRGGAARGPLGRRAGLAVRARHPPRARGQALGLARLAPPREARMDLAEPLAWSPAC